ncbi:MAG: cyclic nucleotide-binding domain-containing protein [Oligoflexus sp.]
MAGNTEGDIVEYQAGEVIFREGDPGGFFILIKSGSVEIYRESKKGLVPLAVLNAGELVGLLTFFNEGQRHASARARVPVVGQLVKKSAALQDMKLPSWVGIVLKEYSFRLTQANNLYASVYKRQSEIASRLIDPLFIACQVADSMVVIGQHYMKKMDDGREMILLKTLTPALQEMLGYKLQEIEQTISVFKNYGLLKIELEPDQGMEVTALKGVNRLKWFTQYAQAARSGKARKQMEAQIPFKCRRILFGLRDFAQKEGLTLNKVIKVDMEDLEARFTEHTKLKLLPEALRQAEEVELLKIHDRNQKVVVEYHPFDLARTIICMNVIHRLKSDSEEVID